MAHFFSIALFLATLIAAAGVIAVMLRANAAAIRHALAGRSLAAIAAEQRAAQAKLQHIRLAPRQRDRGQVAPRRATPLRAAA